jgi:GNAT superfamily N-acetyltransferase
MTHESSALLMNCGRDVEAIFQGGPNAVVRVDSHGWLGLTGEVGCADLNMAAVVQGASPALVADYVGEIRDRGLEAILIVEQDAPELEAAAEGLGLPNVGAVPVMLWENQPTPIPSGRFKVRMAEEADVPVTNELVASAFSLDEAKVQRAVPPSVVKSGADIWMVEDEGEAIGTGMFVRRGDHVGIYCMATPERSQRRGVGRAVLETAIAHYLERGANVFTLEATEAGLHLYEQVGFVTVATPSVFVTAPSTQFPG